MIFERTARREFAQAAAGISIVLLAIVTSIQLIRLLKDAAGGHVAPEGVVALLGFALVKFLPMLLTLTLFVSVLLPLTRMYRDSEMVVWFASGMPLTDWLRPVLRFALPLVVVIAVLSLSLSPWANRVQGDYLAELSARSELTTISPGAFTEVRNGRLVYFVERLDGEVDKIGNVFMASIQEGKLGVVMSVGGRQETRENGDRFLVLENGRRYEVEPGSAAFKIMDFERYAVRNSGGEVRKTSMSPSRMSLAELLEQPSAENLGELIWRLAMPVSALLLAVMALPLAYVNPRSGRSANLLIAILVYAIYSNLILTCQAWFIGGKLPFLVAVLLPHVLMLLPMVALYYGRMSGFRLKRVNAAGVMR
ncbi:LPS export ABC transporter permease LptF [Azonexus hydrophilus]|jgi:lipopolysaccharide export system permease protein|uniref:Lipopolysaccharide export system permease protein LptF n=1 Tax=Azonexus hydrophilus TaxID=418702 RepID=A0ABZ2XI34_9RHOO|nr:LPS export ABC transporter permease LptF [Azonexus hydrophilus]MBS4020376.1 LPS export ABC transporter permease LptF [Dechloromonas sp.]